MFEPLVHILVLDDDRATRDIARRALTAAGYAVAALACADLTAAEVAFLTPDLLVLDLLFERRPEGLALLERLRLHPATLALPVLVITACPQEAAAAADRLAAFGCDVLLKPFRPLELRAAAATALSRRAPAAVA
ncbi:MAG: response regulator transcription factor [Thermomicrobiales bacterium]|nr:response regulator transcription factor [Thermomicrobiales bacterium]